MSDPIDWAETSACLGLAAWMLLMFFTSESELGLETRTGIRAGLFATAWTLLFGWRGFPWGPIRTIRALVHTMGGLPEPESTHRFCG